MFQTLNYPMIKLVVEFDKEVQNGHENVHPYQISDDNEEFIIEKLMDLNL